MPELLLHNLGLALCRNGSTLTGALMIRANLLHAGLDPDDFLFFDGSGLSDHDLVAPRATATFLAYAAGQPWFPQWKASLPDATDEGSLRHRFPDPPVRNHIFAKTGTLGESRALSGYLDAASGRTLIFSIFVDDHTPRNHRRPHHHGQNRNRHRRRGVREFSVLRCQYRRPQPRTDN